MHSIILRPFAAASVMLAIISAPAKTPQDGVSERETQLSDTVGKQVRQYLSETEKDEDALRNLFIVGDEAVPALIKSLRSADSGTRGKAAVALAYIGNDEGREALRRAIEDETDDEAKSGMSLLLAGGLIEGTAKSDLDFLENCVKQMGHGKGDGNPYLATTAALVLAMKGAGDVLPILHKAAGAQAEGSEEITLAIRWIKNKSKAKPHSANPSLSEEELVKRIVLRETIFAEGKSDNASVGRVSFNRVRDKVLVSTVISSGQWSRGYDVVLHKENRMWKVAGIWFSWIS